MKTQVLLKDRPFIIQVVQGNKYNNLLPRFLYESLLESNNEVKNDSIAAISKLYKKIFQTETHFSGVSMIGMDDNNILDELVSDLSFQLFMINLQKISIVIHSIGILTKQGAEYGFALSFIYSKSNECILIFQTVNKDRYSICIYKQNQISEEYRGLDPNSFFLLNSQCKNFMSNKENANLSSYKVDTKTGLPLKYLSNQKEDLEELCSTCSTYRYDIFEDLANIIVQNIENQELQTHLLKKFLKRDYLKYLYITCYGTVSHDSCINYCLLFAFGNCNKEYILKYDKCNKIFNLFEELQLLLRDEQQEILKELQEMLEYYLAHLTRKRYLNS
ncbi:35737_t:CDS:2, partial [Racocetra persica]